MIDTPEANLPERVPFIITDEVGEILVASPAAVKEAENIYKSDIIGEQDSTLIREKACSHTPVKLIVKDGRNGSAMLVLGNMFPSSRALLFLCSDADFSSTAALANEKRLAPTASRAPERIVTGREKEKALAPINNLYSLADILFPTPVCKAFAYGIREKARLIAMLCGCEADIAVSHVPRAARENFDSSLFCLFLFIQFSIASAYSDIRKARLDITVPGAYLTLGVTYERTKNGKTKNNAKVPYSYFDAPLRYFRAVTDRLDLPFSVGTGSTPTAVFSPIRRDFALLGLKARPVLDDPGNEFAKKAEAWLSDITTPINEET